MNLSVYIVCVGSVKRVTCLKGIMNDESAIMCMMIGRNKYYELQTMNKYNTMPCSCDSIHLNIQNSLSISVINLCS